MDFCLACERLVCWAAQRFEFGVAITVVGGGGGANSTTPGC
jgi:hypothetical protein